MEDENIDPPILDDLDNINAVLESKGLKTKLNRQKLVREIIIVEIEQFWILLLFLCH